MHYCKAALKGTGKLSGCIGAEQLCGLFVGYWLSAWSFGFLLGFGKEMEKGCEKFGVMFLFYFYISFMVLLYLSEGFDCNVDLHLEQRIDVFQPFFAVVWL